MPVLDVEQRGAMHSIRRPFPLQFEDNHAAAEDTWQVRRQLNSCFMSSSSESKQSIS